MAGVTGIEPVAPGFGDRCSTSWATPLENSVTHILYPAYTSSGRRIILCFLIKNQVFFLYFQNFFRRKEIISFIKNFLKIFYQNSSISLFKKTVRPKRAAYPRLTVHKKKVFLSLNSRFLFCSIFRQEKRHTVSKRRLAKAIPLFPETKYFFLSS